MAAVDIVVPDLGSDAKAEVIEILVQSGTKVSKDQMLVVLESDKATMEIPCEFEGVLSELVVKVGDQVGSGDLLARLENAEEASAEKTSPAKKESGQTETTKPTKAGETLSKKTASEKVEPQTSPAQNTRQSEKTIVESVPDTGDGEAELIEIHVKVGDEVQQDSILVVLESDKATMEIPASRSGKVTKIRVKLGDKVKHGDALVELLVTQSEDNADEKNETKKEAKNEAESQAVSNKATETNASTASAKNPATIPKTDSEILFPPCQKS